MSTPLNPIDDDINTFDQPRHDWTRSQAEALYDLPFADLIFRAQGIHRRNFDPNHVETASLLSIKTGGCPEDCGYCSQSAQDRRQGDPADGSIGGCRNRAACQGRRRQQVLHGGRMAQSQGQGP
jgi:hypothetical protein